MVDEYLLPLTVSVVTIVGVLLYLLDGGYL